MDISEIWLPLAVAALPAAALVIFVVARRIRPSWLRIPIRLLSGISLPIGALILLLFLLMEISCTAHAPNTWSPDGRHVAVLTYGLQGALGADSAWIKLRRRWSPMGTSVFGGTGAWDFKNEKPLEPQIRWIDATHLLIRFRDDASEPAFCAHHLDGIEILCEPLPFTGGVAQIKPRV